MKILCDIDGVLANTIAEWLRRYNNDFSDKLTPDDIHSWDTHQYVKTECGMDIYNYLSDRDLYDNVEVIDGAKSSIRWLKNRGHEVIFVTSGIQESKALWMQRFGFTESWMFPEDLIVAHHKYHIKGDLIIDDNPKNCDEFGGRAILFGQPWNEDVQTNHFRAEGWPEVVSYISRM